LRNKVASKNLPSSKALNDWLHGMESRLTQVDKKAIATLLEKSAVMQKVASMRKELTMLWEDRSLTAEQMMTSLREWCANAEKSGIAALQTFARELHGYRINQA
jgi:stearoyl-CoA desaturase (delta-9 desaturase)